MLTPLEELLTKIECERVCGRRDRLVSGITCDSRRVKPGDLFVAIDGNKHDGHQYILEAVRKGALAVVGERLCIVPPSVTYITVSDSRRALAELACAFYGFPTQKLFTVGVTGTNGKTSITCLAASVLGREKTELSNTVINALERGWENTTPGPLEIQKLAHDALQAGKENLVLEVSAHALSQGRVQGVDFDVAVFTNLTHDHFDYYQGFDDYLEAKLKLFASLKQSAFAIINRDDAYANEFIKSTRAQILTYGLSHEADLWADGIRLGPEGSCFLAHTPRGFIPIRTKLAGLFYVYNILAAIGVGLTKGISLKQIEAGIEAVNRIEGRFEQYLTKDGVRVVIDFAHSPDSLEKMIRMLKAFYSRVITVFGCGGESDRLKRPIMGKISGQLSDYTIITSDNPKSEDPQTIIREIESGIKSLKAPYEAIGDRRAAICRALQLAKPGDAVLIAGKGHERTQIFKNQEIEFNDKEFLRQKGILA